MELASLFDTLVRFQTSQGSSTLQAGEFIANYCEDLGFKVQLLEYSLSSDKTPKANVVATIGGDEPYLAFAGHIDTVLPWLSKDSAIEPYQVTVKDGKLYGLGTSDMKAFIALALKAVEKVKHKKLRRPFALYFTSDEEAGCLGAKRMIADLNSKGQKLANQILIGEPTEMQPVNLHKGYIYVKIKAKIASTGHSKKSMRTFHSSDDRIASNVVEIVLPDLIVALTRYKKAIRTSIDRRFNPPYPTMNIGGRIYTPQDALKNVIPQECTLENDIRFLPGQDPEELLDALKDRLKGVEESVKLIRNNETLELELQLARNPGLPMDTDPNCSLALALLNLCQAKECGIVAYNTEGGVYNKAGSHSIICGPGSIEQAHKINEYIEAKYITEKQVDFYSRVIEKLCVEEG